MLLRRVLLRGGGGSSGSCSAGVAGLAEGPSAVEPRRHRVQLGPAPTTTDLLWPAGLQTAADLRCLLLHGSHFRTLLPASQERCIHLGSILQGSDRLRYTNIIRGQHRGGLSLMGIGLHPGPGLIGGPSGCQPSQEVFCPGLCASRHFACRTTESSGGQTCNRYSLRLTKQGSRPQKAQV